MHPPAFATLPRSAPLARIAAASLPALLAASALLAVAGCASPAADDALPCCGRECPAAAALAPAFREDGRVRRDLDTGAPLFTADPSALPARAPRFHPDGSVARDVASGAPLFEEMSGGTVVRVLVLRR